MSYQTEVGGVGKDPIIERTLLRPTRHHLQGQVRCEAWNLELVAAEEYPSAYHRPRDQPWLKIRSGEEKSKKNEHPHGKKPEERRRD